MKAKLVNFVLFQLGWFACVLLGGSPWHFWALVVVALAVAVHLNSAPGMNPELRLIGLSLLLGLAWENLLTLSGVLSYPFGQIVGQQAPLWIVAMWPLLATTLNVSLRWMHGKLWLTMAFGAVGGPLAFFAGERMEAVTIANPMLAYLILAAGWAVLFPALVKLAQTYDGFKSPPLALSREAS